MCKPPDDGIGLGLAPVAFDMAETRVSGGDTVSYVPGEDARGLADAVVALADNPTLRKQRGAAARKRIEDVLCWEKQAHTLLEVYRKLFPGEIAQTEIAYDGTENR